MFEKNLLVRIQNIKNYYLWLFAIVSSLVITEIIVSVMSLIFNGVVTFDYLITGLVASVLVASLVSGIIIFFIRKLSELHRDNGYLTELIDACPTPIAINDRASNIVMLNREFTKVYGYTLDDIPTLDDWWQRAYPDEQYRNITRNSWRAQLKDVHTNNTRFEPLEVKVHCKNGEAKLVMATATALGNGYKEFSLVVLYDISERALLADAIAESNTILQAVIESIPVRVFWKDHDLRYLGCNTAFARDAGQASSLEIIGKLDADLAWQDHAELYQSDDHHVMTSKQSKLAFEEAQTTPNGDTIWLRTSKSPLLDSTGKALGILGIYEDITKQKKIEDSLWLSQTFIDKSKTAFFTISATGQIKYVNEYACASLGYTKDELIGMSPWQFDPDFSEAVWPTFWSNLIRNDIFSIESRHQRKDGTTFDIDVTAHYITFGDEEYAFTFVQDISTRKKAEKGLQQKEGYQRALIDNFPFEVWLKDTDSHFLAVNQTFCNTFDLPSKEYLVGKTDFDIAPPDLAESYRKDDRDVMASRQQKMIEERVQGSSHTKWVETFKAPVINDAGTLLGTVGFFRDITDRKMAEAELHIAAIAFESQEGMIVTDSTSTILRINKAFTRITGFSEQEAIGKKMKLLRSGVHDTHFYSNMWETIQQSGSWQGEIWNRRKNGEIYPEWLTITAVYDEDDSITHYVGNMIDITTRKAIEQQVQHLAHHDPLTDLPNRALLNDRLHQALAQARRDNEMLAIMYLDLDDFKPVNDSLGHDVGDLLLKEVATRLLSCVKRQSDTVSRMGGDEFVVLITDVEQQRDIELIAENIVNSLSLPFIIEAHNVNISASLGIAIYPQSGTDSISLMKNADNAMYEAKNAGRNCFKIFSDEIKRPLTTTDDLIIES